MHTILLPYVLFTDIKIDWHNVRHPVSLLGLTDRARGTEINTTHTHNMCQPYKQNAIYIYAPRRSRSFWIIQCAPNLQHSILWLISFAWNNNLSTILIISLHRNIWINWWNRTKICSFRWIQNIMTNFNLRKRKQRKTIIIWCSFHTFFKLFQFQILLL